MIEGSYPNIIIDLEMNYNDKFKVTNYIRLKSLYLVPCRMHISSERSNGYFGAKNKGN